MQVNPIIRQLRNQLRHRLRNRQLQRETANRLKFTVQAAAKLGAERESDSGAHHRQVPPEKTWLILVLACALSLL